jgi:hypothetical protein
MKNNQDKKGKASSPFRLQIALAHSCKTYWPFCVNIQILQLLEEELIDGVSIMVVSFFGLSHIRSSKSLNNARSRKWIYTCWVNYNNMIS